MDIKEEKQKLEKRLETINKILNENEEHTYSITAYGKTYPNCTIKRFPSENATQKFDRIVYPILQGLPEDAVILNMDDAKFCIEHLKKEKIIFTNEIIDVLRKNILPELSEILKIIKRSVKYNSKTVMRIIHEELHNFQEEGVFLGMIIGFLHHPTEQGCYELLKLAFMEFSRIILTFQRNRLDVANRRLRAPSFRSS